MQPELNSNVGVVMRATKYFFSATVLLICCKSFAIGGGWLDHREMKELDRVELEEKKRLEESERTRNARLAEACTPTLGTRSDYPLAPTHRTPHWVTSTWAQISPKTRDLTDPQPTVSPKRSWLGWFSSSPELVIVGSSPNEIVQNVGPAMQDMSDRVLEVLKSPDDHSPIYDLLYEALGTLGSINNSRYLTPRQLAAVFAVRTLRVSSPLKHLLK